ncbi:hypothetical protein FHS40_001795 [Streptomyces spectabilis]|uniref:Uncharacterized protein n=1 Tax=Streptomyces spectabilis TaxID=68270 RepID=A0A7W8ASX3_STRST|nr:hypothetical protein [Streptomyces spectabilis]
MPAVSPTGPSAGAAHPCPGPSGAGALPGRWAAPCPSLGLSDCSSLAGLSACLGFLGLWALVLLGCGVAADGGAGACGVAVDADAEAGGRGAALRAPGRAHPPAPTRHGREGPCRGTGDRPGPCARGFEPGALPAAGRPHPPAPTRPHPGQGSVPVLRKLRGRRPPWARPERSGSSLCLTRRSWPPPGAGTVAAHVLGRAAGRRGPVRRRGGPDTCPGRYGLKAWPGPCTRTYCSKPSSRSRPGPVPPPAPSVSPLPQRAAHAPERADAASVRRGPAPPPPGRSASLRAQRAARSEGIREPGRGAASQAGSGLA